MCLGCTRRPVKILRRAGLVHSTRLAATSSQMATVMAPELARVDGCGSVKNRGDAKPKRSVRVGNKAKVDATSQGWMQDADRDGCRLRRATVLIHSRCPVPNERCSGKYPWRPKTSVLENGRLCGQVMEEDWCCRWQVDGSHARHQKTLEGEGRLRTC